MRNYHLKKVEDIPSFLDAKISEEKYLSLPLWQRWYYESDCLAESNDGTSLAEEIDQNPGWQPV